MTTLEWLAFFVLLTAALAAAAATILSNGMLTRAIRRLEQTYRREKSLELEQLQAQGVSRRKADVDIALSREGGWREVAQQLLADALPEETVDASGDSWITALDVAAAPPHFVLARQDGSGDRFLFSTALDRKEIGRRARVIPLDASLSPAARVEAEAVWRHLADKQGLAARALPRQAEWILVAQGGKDGRARNGKRR